MYTGMPAESRTAGLASHAFTFWGTLPVLIFSLSMDVMKLLCLLFSGCASNAFWISNKSHNTHFKSQKLLQASRANIQEIIEYWNAKCLPGHQTSTSRSVQLSAPPQQASCSLSLSTPLLHQVWEICLTWICFKSEENLTKGEMWFRNPRVASK